MKYSLQARRARRAARTRSHLRGTSTRPRLTVFRSNKHIFAQLIDDTKSETIVSASDSGKEAKGTKREKAAAVGKLIATKALKKGIKRIVFDRGSYKYHGRVAELAEAARKEGLEF